MRQIILVRRIISVPCDNVKHRVVVLSSLQVAAKFVDNVKSAVAVLIPRHWRLEIAWVGQPIGSNRTEVGNSEVAVVDFEHVGPRRPRHIDSCEDEW